jgi:hypothetical protein
VFQYQVGQTTIAGILNFVKWDRRRRSYVFFRLSLSLDRNILSDGRILDRVAREEDDFLCEIK